MVRAAGVMLLTPTDEVLFLKRSASSDHPGEWCFPGGVIEAGETAEDAARREVREEIGPFGYSALTVLTRRIDEQVDFTTLLGRVPGQSTPELSDEHTGWAWAKRTQPPEPLHPGCRIALARPDMNELDIARAMAAGELVSPQRYGTFWMFNIRLTATGLSYRSALEEFVWRDKSLYLNDEFLARANGTPVIFEHPDKKPKLDSEEFNKRIVGVTFLPFIRDEDVWAVVKIYDEPTAQWMMNNQISTSSGVVFGETSGNQKLKTEDGRTLLIEGVPKLWDHIALVTNGVWDKGGPPSGVDSLSQQEPLVAEETAEEKKAREEREDRARKDAERMDRLDTVLNRMDARLDALEKDQREDRARKDAEEDRERRDRECMDAARKDRFAHRKDGESYKDWKARHDADEMAMVDMLEKGGVAKDKARKDAKDCRMDAEKNEGEAGGESFKKWAEEEARETEHNDKARRDAEEKEREEREDRARKDAAMTQENADLRSRLAAAERAIKTLTTEVPADERDALAKAQSRADSVSAMFGERAPTPMAGESSLDYRKRLLKKYQAHSPKFKDTRFDSADSAMLEPVEGIVYNDAAEAAKSPAQHKVGVLMPVESRDHAGRTITRYVGDPMAWMQHFMPPGPQGRFIRNPGQGAR